jgi:peptide deformylase
MATLPIIIAPDPRLKVKCTPIDTVDAEIATLMTDMLETMYLAPGIGLAAPQIGVTKRIIVVDASGKDDDPRPIKMANPKLLSVSEALWTYEEGCLSLPDHFAEVERPAQIRIGYIDENNEPQELEAGELLATCIQHEMDHLEGTLFVDHISALKRNMILRKLVKLKKLKANDAAAD